MTKSSLGVALLGMLGSTFCILDLLAYFTGIVSTTTLLFYAGVAGFGLYSFGSLFFDYVVYWPRSTSKPTDPWGLRVFQAAIGLFMWGTAVFVLLTHW